MYRAVLLVPSLVFLITVNKEISADNTTKIRWRVLRKLKDVNHLPPEIKELNQSKIRVAGYMVPLESNENGVIEFLLVPISGQCIHIPPPPANQMIYVTMKKGKEADYTDKSVMVYGTFSVQARQNKYGKALYGLASDKVLAF